jgi:hypothetical protein
MSGLSVSLGLVKVSHDWLCFLLRSEWLYYNMGEGSANFTFNSRSGPNSLNSVGK